MQALDRDIATPAGRGAPAGNVMEGRRRGGVCIGQWLALHPDSEVARRLLHRLSGLVMDQLLW